MRFGVIARMHGLLPDGPGVLLLDSVLARLRLLVKVFLLFDACCSSQVLY